MRNLLIFIVFIGLFSCGVDAEKIPLIKKGMSKEMVFAILGDKGWSDYNDNSYEYYWLYYTPSANKRFIYVIIKDGVVVDTYSTY